MLAGNGSVQQTRNIAAEFIGRLNFDRDPLPAIALTANTSIQPVLRMIMALNICSQDSESNSS